MAEKLSVKELKALCKQHNVSTTGCAEKQDLVALVAKHSLLDKNEVAAEASNEGVASEKPSSGVRGSWHLQRSKRRILDKDCHVVPVNLDASNKPEAVVLLFHGYGAEASNFLPVVDHVANSHLTNKKALFVLPQATDSAWWPINFLEMGAELMSGEQGIARAIRKPIPGMPEATDFVHKLIEHLSNELSVDTEHFILGGFSQGAILATNSTLMLPKSPKGLLCLSGLPLTVEEWAKHSYKHKGLPVYQAHGTGDPLLPYAAAGWLQALLAQGGLDVQFESHNGGHDLGPPDMLNKLGKFLAEL